MPAKIAVPITDKDTLDSLENDEPSIAPRQKPTRDVVQKGRKPKPNAERRKKIPKA